MNELRQVSFDIKIWMSFQAISLIGYMLFAGKEGKHNLNGQSSFRREDLEINMLG